MAQWLRTQALQCESQLHHVLAVWSEQVTELLWACSLTRKEGTAIVTNSQINLFTLKYLL